jgi:hypothetical protein
LDAAPQNKRKRAKSTTSKPALHSPRNAFVKASSPNLGKPTLKPSSARGTSAKLKTIAPGIRASSPSPSHRAPSPTRSLDARSQDSRAPALLVDSAVEERLIHCLALKRWKFEALASHLHRPMSALIPVLKRAALVLDSSTTTVTDSLSSTQPLALRPEQFKLIKLHEWTEYSQKDREIVARNANRAFDELGLKKNAPERFQFSSSLVPISTTQSSLPRSESAHSNLSDGSVKRKREDSDVDKPAKLVKLQSPSTPVDHDELVKMHEKLLGMRSALEKEVIWLSSGKEDVDRFAGVVQLKKDYQETLAYYKNLSK